MSSAAPWSVKGIDPKAREIAKDLARRSGMTLGEWLNQVILDDGGIEPVEELLPPRQTFPGSSFAGPAYAAQHAHRPIGETPTPHRSTYGAASAYRRIETPEHPGDELYRITEALERLTGRIEAAEHRSTLAISGIEQSVAGVVTRLSSTEREQTAVAARFEGAVDDVRVEQTRLTERLRRTEQEAAGARSSEALRAMEGALAKVAGHLYEGEARTREDLSDLRGEIGRIADAQPVAGADLIDQVVARVGERLSEAEGKTREAMRGLEASFAGLDHRLAATETRIGARGSDAGLEQLAASLSAKVDAARAEMAEKLRVSADGRFERVERSIQEMTGHVQAAERRSAEAIERMGHEVLRMADTLNRKVESTEARSTAAFQQVGGEMARIANVVEGRLTRMDDAGAQALEKLGAEIARITERLSERIAAAERRSAQAIDDVSNNVARISDRMQDRQERGSTELTDRIRQSEERTARLLEDARMRIDERLAETPRGAAEPRAERSAAFTPPPYPDPGYPAQGFTDVSFSTSTFSDPAVADADIAPFGERSFDLPPPPAAAPPIRFTAPDDMPPPPVFAPARPAAHAEPFARESLFGAPIPPAPGLEDEPSVSHFAEPAMAPAAEAEAEHDPLEAALAASARRTGGGFLDEDRYGADSFDAGEPEADADADDGIFAPAQSTKAVIEQARAAARASSEAAGGRGKGGGGLFGGFGRTKAKSREGSTLRTAFLMSGTAAAVGVALAGYEILAEKPSGALPRRVAEALNGGKAAEAAPSKPISIEVGEPIAAVALNPRPIGPANSLPASPAAAAAKFAAPSPDAAAEYAAGARRIESHDNAGVDELRKAANLGYAPAQFYLAKLYENGGAGMHKDMDEARRWTERAAQGGDKKAMHNLALYYFEGTGGPKNAATAAQWFHRAADLGLVDSQYNLGRLYEEGFGVAQNPAEAYKWYLIAARQGDTESRTSAQRLKHQLSPEAQATAERAAQAFQGTATGPVSEAAVPAGQTANIAAQKALSRLGYYKGPTDGAESPALKLAIAAYQRDQGLQPTGQMDTALAQLFAAVAQ